jgi:hypothetical protein
MSFIGGILQGILTDVVKDAMLKQGKPNPCCFFPCSCDTLDSMFSGSYKEAETSCSCCDVRISASNS